MDRFLRNIDYLSVTTQKHFDETTRMYWDTVPKIELEAKEQIIENMTENYQIEDVFLVGERIKEYNPYINYPIGSYFWVTGEDTNGRFIDKCYLVLETLSNRYKPGYSSYWEELPSLPPGITEELILPYKQFGNFYVNSIVSYDGYYFRALKTNGYDFNNVVRPLLSNEIDPWEIQPYLLWEEGVYDLDQIVKSNDDRFYILTDLTGLDPDVRPQNASQNWTAIVEYVDTKTDYQIGVYVSYDGEPFKAIRNPNSSEFVIGSNVVEKDPRNQNIVRHMIMIAWYKISRKIAPNMISQTKIMDYEEACKWLQDCNRGRITPGIPRRTDANGNALADWAFADFDATGESQINNPWVT